MYNKGVVVVSKNHPGSASTTPIRRRAPSLFAPLLHACTYALKHLLWSYRCGDMAFSVSKIIYPAAIYPAVIFRAVMYPAVIFPAVIHPVVTYPNVMYYTLS